MAGKVTRSDWSAQVPASGIIGKIAVGTLPAKIPAANLPPPPIIDIGKLTGLGFLKTQYPLWNGGKFVPAYLPPFPPPGSVIIDRDRPAVATRTLFDGDIWLREIFDVVQYGADPSGFNDSFGPVAAAIADLITNGRGCLYFPAGNYTFGSPPPDIPVPCLIRGDGIGASNLTFLGAGFSGGDGGSFFGAQGMSLVTDGTASAALSITDGTSSYLTDGTAIPLSDGTNVGELFGFHDLQIAGFATGISVNAGSRQGFISRCRIFPTAVGLNLSCLGAQVSDCIFINAGSSAAIAAILGGDYHSMHGIRIFSGVSNWASGIEVMSGFGLALADMVIYGCDGAAIDLTGCASARVQNISFGGILGISQVVFDPALHYVNELHGLGGNTNSTYDLRKELATSVTWTPGTLRILESATIDVSVAGADLGDQCDPGTPDSTDFLQVSARVVADDVIRITITNMSMNVIVLPSGTYKVRCFN